MILSLAAAGSSVSHGVSAETARFVLQLAVILITSRILGSLTARYLKLPRVLGELTTGIIIGPFALGAISLGSFGPLFPLIEGSILPISSELYAVGSVAAILLLFLAGLETDLSMFMHFAFAGSVVGLFGVVISFTLGDLCAVWFGMASSFMDPSALFLGAVATATSVGITARILSEKNRLDGPEGVTIMASAVLDDILGVVMVSVIASMAATSGTSDGVEWGSLGILAGKAVGFFILCTTAALLSARKLSMLIKVSKDPGTMVTFSFGLALLLAGLTEMAGLAMIIGAYVAGLALSRTDLAIFIQEKLEPVADLFIPVFFCIMGMMVNVGALQGVLLFGLVYSLVGVFSKVAGCGLAALLVRFNPRGALRIGLGMLPRGEVALIVAGVGYASGALSTELFGVAIMMTMLTTLAAPPLLMKSLQGPEGTSQAKWVPKAAKTTPFKLPFPSVDIAEFMLTRIIKALQQEEFFVSRINTANPFYQVRKDHNVFSIRLDHQNLVSALPDDIHHIIKFIIAEELLALKDLMEASSQMKDLETIESELFKDAMDDHHDERSR